MRLYPVATALLLACEPGIVQSPVEQSLGAADGASAPGVAAATEHTASTLVQTPGASAKPLWSGSVRPSRTFEALAAAPTVAPSLQLLDGAAPVRTVEADLGPVATAHGGAFQVSPRVVFLDAAVSTPTVHRDAPEASVDVILTEDGAAATGILVEATLSSAGWGSPRPASCTSDSDGRCSLSWTLDSADFDALSSVALATAAFDVAGVVIETDGEVPSMALFPSPAPLVVSRPGIGLQLPTVPLAAGDAVLVPVYVETTGTIPAAYDLRIEFDPAALEVTGVTGGSCSTFAAPVHNGGGLANQTGVLLMNAISPSVTDPCVTAERVHVATITLRVRDDAPAGPLAVGCRVRDLFDTNFWKLAHDKACDVADLYAEPTEGGGAGGLLVE